MDNDALIHCAFRYCLGRKTYIVGDMVNYLRKNWIMIGDPTRGLILDEITEALEEGRAGMDMDCDAWRCLLNYAYDIEKGTKGATYE